MARMLVWSAMETIFFMHCLIVPISPCSSAKVLPISPKLPSTSWETSFKAATSDWAWATDWDISVLTLENSLATWLMLEKCSPKSSSFVWKTTASVRTPSKAFPTMLSSKRESTSFFTSSCW